MKRFFLSIGSLLLVLLASAQEYRGALSADFSLLPNLDAEAEIELRKVFYPGSYFNRTFQGKISYSWSPSWQTGLSYSYAIIDKDEEFSDDAEGESAEKHKISLDIGYETKRMDNDLKFSNRFRIQMSTLDDKKPKPYIRDRFMVDYRITKKFKPYIGVEPYFHLRQQKFKVVRFYLGSDVTLFGTDVDIYYIAEVKPVKYNSSATYILGIAVKLDYRK